MGVRFVDGAAALGRPDLVVLPGTKATVADLEWLRGRGLHTAIEATGAPVLGICGGYQMMGRTIVDDVESNRGTVAGLGWLDAETVFEPTKVTRQRRGHALFPAQGPLGPTNGSPATRSTTAGSRRPTRGSPWTTPTAPTPRAHARGRFSGTTLHGLFEDDGFRAAFLGIEPSGVSFAAAREAQIDRLADMLEAHLDLTAIDNLIKEAT